MASMDFTELFAVITSTPTTGTWTSIDLTSLGVPDNAVVCVLCQHFTDDVQNYMGVREVGSVLSRLLKIHEPESGGSTSLVMHVQSDATASIQYYTGDGSTIFTLLGYYGSGITYTEEMTLHEPTSADWRSTAVGQNNIVFEFSCANLDQADSITIGVRKVGSSLVRYYAIHESEPWTTEFDSYTSYAQSDSSGNIEMYRAATFGRIYRIGYFSSNVQLEERFDLCTPAADATWGEQTIVAGGENCVALIACMHQSTGTEENTGARGGASAVNRYWLEHEAEPSGFTGDTLPVLVDATGKYDTYFGDVSDGLFYCLGYLYDTGGAPPSTFIPRIIMF